jgi:DNA-binding response OmpR family regulator
MNNKIMIVEDDLISAAYLKKLCIENGFEVCAMADNAKEALVLVKEYQPHLILMDIMIKGAISGCELSMQIRTFDKEVEIIFLTAYSSDEMIEYALDARAYSYLLKPYRDIEIVSTIKMALKQKRKIVEEENPAITCKNGYSYLTETSKLLHYHDEVILTGKVKELFELLVLNRGTAVSYEQISMTLWNEEQNMNTLRAIVHRLKTQLSDLELHSVSKTGYVLY